MDTRTPSRIGEVVGAEAGPTFVVIGGVHGNEPAGVAAAADVLEALQPRRGKLRGRVVALRGNRRALARGERFVSRDLNRLWQDEALLSLRAAPLETLADEDREQRELLDELLRLERESAEPTVLVDLHSTSGSSEPFVCLADTAANRMLACALPVCAIVGLERTIEGTMLAFWVDRGHAGIAFEGGRHDDPETRRRHVSAVWTVLIAAGAIDARHVPALAESSRCLVTAAETPRVVEVLHRHLVRPGDDFEMLPGFTSFEPIARGQLVARDRHGEVRVPVAGRMLMPRYQAAGEDGYFVVGEIAQLTGGERGHRDRAGFLRRRRLRRVR